MNCPDCNPHGTDRAASVELHIARHDGKKYCTCNMCGHRWEAVRPTPSEITSLAVSMTIRDGMLLVEFNQHITALQFDKANAEKFVRDLQHVVAQL